MPTPRLDDANIEFSFTVEESMSARILDPLRISWLQTKYARLWKEKASKLMPTELSLDRVYVQEIAELEGKLGLIQELFDDHKAALKELTNQKLYDLDGMGQGTTDSLAQRAAKLV